MMKQRVLIAASLAALMGCATTESAIVQQQADSGVLSVHKNDHPALWKEEGHRRVRGTQSFKTPFEAPPVVVIALSHVDFHGDPNQRINVRIEEISREGFTYVFHTWADTKLWRADASWIAVSRTDTDTIGPIIKINSLVNVGPSPAG